MSDMTDDFNEDFAIKYLSRDLDVVWKLIDLALEDDKDSSKENWESSLCKEKHDALNYTYHISLNKIDDPDEVAEVSFYTGIDVGCELVGYSLGGCSLAHKPMTQRVMYDIELDLSRMNPNVNVKAAQAMLSGNKAHIMDIYNKQGYDNYVTGGGTISTDKHYKDKFARLNEQGLYWKCLYREEEFDRNFV